MIDKVEEVDTIFCVAIEMEDAELRAGYVEKACDGNVKLKEKIDKLLSAHFEAGGFLTDTDQLAGVEWHLKTGSQVGRYKLREKIGEGGFGVVYVAEQKHPVKRKVALKVIKPGMDSKDIIARFEAERQALAMMDHPNVAKVYDAGATDSGRPYFAMELVHGTSITQFCDEQKLTNRQRLELFVDVCDAVQHAHQKGIIHRDLKPSNVMVTTSGDRLIPKVIDFGVAKALHHELTDKSIYTAYGQLVGTPMYMSPEQAQMSSLDIDTRSDIYSLGVLLYELLTGATPFDKETFKQAGFDEMRRIIREDEPRRPSDRVSTLNAELQSTVSKKRNIDQRTLSRSLRGELDWIILRAMEKDRTRRYETANGLAADVKRYLNDESVLACPPTTIYRIRKFAARNKSGLTIVIAASFMVVFAVASLLISNSLLASKGRETANALSVAEREKKRVRAIHDFVIDQIVRSANPLSKAGSREITVRESLVEAYYLIDETFQDDVQLAAHVALNFADYLDSIGEYELASEAANNATDVFIDEYGLDHPYTLNAKRLVVRVDNDLRKFDRALANANEVVKLSKARFGLTDEEHVKSLLVLSETLVQSREVNDAEKALKQLIDLCQKNDFPEELAHAYNLLANNYLSQHRIREAQSNWELALSQFEKLESTFNIWAAKTNLNMAIYDAGNHARAIELSQQLAIQATERFGTDHPHTCHAFRQLADLTFRTGNHNAALTHYRTLLDRTQTKYGPNNARTAEAMSYLGQCLNRLGKSQDAVDLLQGALEIQTARLGESDRQTISTLGRLASAYSENGSFEKASGCFQKAIEVRRGRALERPEDAGNLVSLAVLYHNLGRMLRQQRRLAEAIESFSQALEILEPIASERSSALQTKSFGARSTTFAMMQRWDEAIEDANQSGLHATTASSECSALVLKSYFLAKGSGDVDESIDIVEGVLRREKESVGLLTATAVENVVRLAGSICNRGNRLRENRESQRAIEYYATAIRFLDLSDSKMAKDNRANTYLNRARALVDMTRLEDACDDVDRAVENAPSPDRADFMLMWKSRFLAQRGMANEAMRIIEDVTKRKSEGSDLYFAARTLALCAKAIHQAQSSETSRSTDQFSTCVTKCIALLVKADDVGYFQDQDRIVAFLNEEDFASIRSVPEFAQFTRHISKLMENETK